MISGSARSLKLISPKGDNTRPTTDKIKETLFNILNFQLYDTYFLDLFAGSGAIGIEALSRGAKYCVFVESDKSAISCIQKNILNTKFTDKSEIFTNDIKYSLKKISNKFKQSFDIVFMDPPYNKGLEKEVLEYLKALELISDTTLIIIEMAIENDINWIIDIGFEIIREKNYKSNKHIFIRRGR